MPTFKEWLAKFINTDDHVGFITQVVGRDKEFPDTADVRIVIKYVNNAAHFDGLLNAFYLVWEQYQKELADGPNIPNSESE